MNIRKLSIRLDGFSGNLLEKIPDRNKALDIKVAHRVKIDQMEGGTEAVYHLYTDVAPSPQALFTCQVDQDIHVEFTEAVSKEEVETMAYQICSNGANQLSFIVASMTRELIETPILLPTSLNAQDFEIV